MSHQSQFQGKWFHPSKSVSNHDSNEVSPPQLTSLLFLDLRAESFFILSQWGNKKVRSLLYNICSFIHASSKQRQHFNCCIPNHTDYPKGKVQLQLQTRWLIGTGGDLIMHGWRRVYCCCFEKETICRISCSSDSCERGCGFKLFLFLLIWNVKINLNVGGNSKV